MNLVELVCDQCGQTFARSWGVNERGKREGRTTAFCSRRCANEAQRPDVDRSKVPAIPWLKPRNWQEQALGEMIAGASIEFQHCLPSSRNDAGPTRHVGIDYWNGYWAALIDYGRRIFEVRAYNGPGDDRDYEESTTTEDDGAPSIPEETLPDV